jgi:hypothetical protein
MGGAITRMVASEHNGLSNPAGEVMERLESDLKIESLVVCNQK